MGGNRRADGAGNHLADIVGSRFGAERRNRGNAVVEAAFVPEAFLGTADTPMSGLHRPRNATVPAHGRARVVGGRTLAAHLVQAVPLARTLVIPGFGKLASIEVPTAIALVVNALTVEHLRPPLAIEFRQAIEGQHVGDDASHHFGDRRTARHVDDRLAGDHLVHRRRAGRVGLGGLHATVGSAGAPTDDGLGVGGGFLEHFNERAAAMDAEHAVLVERRIALHGQDVIALVLLLDLLDDRLGLVAGGGHQRVVVIERQHGKHDILGQRVCRTDEGLGTAGAFQSMQPDDRRARLGFQRMRDTRRSGASQAQRGRRQAAEFQEAAPGDPLAAQHFVKGLGHGSFPR